jgi:amino acid transporter/mannitol/fructose-specific phosphotransferase system IIA component (Ntr-type)
MRLKKALTLFDVFAIASGAMISSGLFILPGLAFAKAGPAIIISYLLAGLLSLPGMLSIAEMITAMPKAGGDIFTIIRSMGPGIGTIAGILSWFSLSMKATFALVGMAVFTNLIVSFEPHLISIAFCLVFVLINFIGIKEAGRTQTALVIFLLMLMIIYITRGFPAVKIDNFIPFLPLGIGAVFSTAGFVFVAYAGLLKIASIAEEIKNPARNISLGLLLSLCVVSVLYALMIFVTVGVLDAPILRSSLTPISDGANVFMPGWGRIALTVAAIAAFLTTANAGIMTSARSLVPLSRDKLLPRFFSNIHPRFKTPHYSLLFTGLFIIVALFLKLEILVKGASLVYILTNVLSCLSVIIIRESRLQNYQPSFRTPFYPWLQIIGIIGLIFLIIEMGNQALLISAVLIVIGFLIYWFYGKARGWREYAFLHLIERITNRQLVDGHLESELKEIIRERDSIVKDRFDDMIEESVILDINKRISVEEFFKQVADAIADKFYEEPESLYKLLIEREQENTTVLHKHIAIPHIIVEGKQKFSILIARSKEGIEFYENAKDIHAAFVLIGSKDERNFHLRTLAAFAQIFQEHGFEKKWLRAKNIEALRDIILLGKRRR